MTAIEAKDSVTAIRLLGLGAKPEIDFAAYMRAYQSKHDPPKDSKQNRHNFEQSLQQPVLLAVQHELPLLAKSLIEDHGGDPNTLTTDGHRVLNNHHTRRHTKGTTLLDQVTKKLKSLRDWKYEVTEPEAPMPLEEDAEYLSPFQPGTYAFWSANKQFQDAKEQYKDDLEAYHKKVEDQKDMTGVAEKQDAINRLIVAFEQLEAILLERGAKPFYELHPDVERPEKHDRQSYHHHRHEPIPFSVSLDFKLADLTQESQQRYEKLFEAAWSGDVKEVKELTLIPWKNPQDDDEPPSKVAVQDQHGLSPFSIAMLRGSFDLAKAIMEIAHAQYFKTEPPKLRRYEMDPGDSEDDASGDDEDVPLHSEIVDDEFTIENIGEVSMLVKSRVLPSQMLMWSIPSIADFANSTATSARDTGNSGFGSGNGQHTLAGKRTNTGSIKLPSPAQSPDLSKRETPEPTTLLRFALYTNNPSLLNLILDFGSHYTEAQPGKDDEEASKIFVIPHQDFEYALRIGHVHLLAELVKVTGAGIPLNSLAKKYGAELKEKPKYYQGLTVHGKKRKDWAQAGYDFTGYSTPRNCNPPLLTAAQFGSFEAVEWLLSDSPVRCYNEFAKANEDDKRLQQLSLSENGFQGTIQKFLIARSRTVIHCCLAGDYTAEADSLFRYLLETMPDCIEARSLTGT